MGGGLSWFITAIIVTVKNTSFHNIEGYAPNDRRCYTSSRAKAYAPFHKLLRNVTLIIHFHLKDLCQLLSRKFNENNTTFIFYNKNNITDKLITSCKNCYIYEFTLICLEPVILRFMSRLHRFVSSLQFLPETHKTFLWSYFAKNKLQFILRQHDVRSHVVFALEAIFSLDNSSNSFYELLGVCSTKKTLESSRAKEACALVVGSGGYILSYSPSKLLGCFHFFRDRYLTYGIMTLPGCFTSCPGRG